MSRQPVTDMTDDDIEAEIEFWRGFYAECERIGQGISSKEAIRRRDLEGEQERRANAHNCANGYHSWIGFSRKLPADTKCDHCDELYGDPS